MKKEKTFDNANTTTNSKQLEVLKTNFPQCFDKKGDFIPRKMQEVVAKDGVNLSKESYSLNWLGKSYARLLANEQPLTLFKEDTEHNQKQINKNSENLLIKGDNLEVLKHLRRAYSQSIKMIYIDPPYNTGGDDFVYQDDRKFTPEQLQRLAGIDEDEAQRILDFTNSNSNSHSAWLTFIYPRLYIARELLTDDGVIFISIDDNEQAQLKLLCDEVFGEENFVGKIARKQSSGSKNDTGDNKVTSNMDDLLVFSKINFNFFHIKKKSLKKYTLKDDIGNFKTRALEMQGGGDTLPLRKNMGYSIYYHSEKNSVITKKDYDLLEQNVYLQPDAELSNKGYKCYRPRKRGGEFGIWRWGQDTFMDMFEKNGVYVDEKRVYLKDRQKDFISFYPNALLTEYLNTQGTNEVKELFDTKRVFSFPKPTNLIKYLLRISTDKGGRILDFFAGSGTTADAVMQLNAEDDGNRKFIMVQLPEPINKKKNKTAYDFVKNELGNDNPTIFDITKERIIRAAKKIKTDNEQAKAKDKKDLSKQDFGFKVFETLPMFDGYFDEMDTLDEQQDFFDGTKLSNEDLTILLTSWMVNDGIKLTAKLETMTLDKYTGYYVDKKLYLMDKGFTTDDLKALLEKLDNDKDFQPNEIILFGYNFKSKHQREISEALKSYTNKKQIELNRVIRYYYKFP